MDLAKQIFDELRFKITQLINTYVFLCGDCHKIVETGLTTQNWQL